jgi:hypothetical protein
LTEWHLITSTPKPHDGWQDIKLAGGRSVSGIKPILQSPGYSLAGFIPHFALAHAGYDPRNADSPNRRTIQRIGERHRGLRFFTLSNSE